MSSLPASAPSAGALGDVGAADQRVDERRDLGGVGRAVGVEHDDDVTGDRREAAGEGVALPGARLGHDRGVRTQPAGDGDGVVDRVAVDEDDLGVPGQLGKHQLQVPRLVARGDDDGERRVRGPGHVEGS